MTEEETEAVSAWRLAVLFSQCHAPDSFNIHTWNSTARECIHCKAPYPYPRDEP